MQTKQAAATQSSHVYHAFRREVVRHLEEQLDVAPERAEVLAVEHAATVHWVFHAGYEPDLTASHLRRRL